MFLNLFISVRLVSDGFFPSIIRAQNCTYSVKNFSDRYCYLLLARLEAGSNLVKRCIFLVILCEYVLG